MPTFRTELPAVSKHMGFDIRRTPQSSPIHAIITSEDLTVCDTHYWHGRTIPCERPSIDNSGTPQPSTCEACNEGTPFRTHVYFFVYDPKKAEHFIFECTSHAAKPLSEYRAANGTLRGCIIFARRPKGLKNSKVSIETATANLAKQRIPESPNIIQALSVIWRLPRPALPIEHQRGRQPTVKPDHNRIKNMREQPDNMPNPDHISVIINGNGQKPSSL